MVFMCFETAEYPCLRRRFLSTAFLQTFLETEKANRLGEMSSIFETLTKK